MGLSPEQQAARKGKMTGSRIKPILEEDEEGTMRTWREMTDQATEEDIKYWQEISESLPVILGDVTEQAHLDYFEKKESVYVIQRGLVVTSKEVDYFACTLDGFVEQTATPYVVEAKYVGGRESFSIIRERYFPQCQWNMLCTGANKCMLTVIAGGTDHAYEMVERNNDYIAEAVTRAHQFIACVRRKIRPYPILPPVPVPPRTGDIDMMNTPKGNEWGHWAPVWIETRSAAKQHEEAAEALKKMVPADAKRAHGAGLEINVSRGARAAKTIKPLKEAA